MTGNGATRWGLVALVVGAGIVTSFHVGKAPPALPAIRAELGLGLVAGGWVVSVFSALGATVALGVGSISDRVGHKRTIVTGLCIAAIGSLAGGFAHGAALLIASRVLEGLGYIVVAVAAPSIIASAASGPDRRFALGLWGAYMPAGTSLMMLASPLALDALGWRALWHVVAAVTLLAAVIFLRHADVPAGAAAPSPRRTSLAGNLRLTLSRPGPWLLGILFAFYTVQFAALLAWLPSFMIEERDFSTALAATLTAIWVGVNVPGNLLAGWLLRRGSSHWALIAIAGAVMGLCGLGIFSSALGDGTRYFLCLLLSFAGGMLPATALATVPAVAPSPAQAGTTNGMLVQGANLGLLVGPPALAAVVTATGNWQGSAVLMAAAGGAIVLLALLLRRLEMGSSAIGKGGP